MSGSVDEQLTIEARLKNSVTAGLKAIGKDVTQFAQTTKQQMKSAFNSIVSIKGAIVGVAAKKAWDTIIGQAGQFQKKMQEVGTLSSDISSNIGMFSNQVRALSEQSGQSLEVLTKSLYDSISAGIDAGGAMEFLTTSTRLAIGGATDTAIAVDGLTTIINGYGLEASAASDISDAMFTAMKFGKTTIGELATSIGPLVPTAKAAGVEFDAMLGSVSALTKAGFQTKLAVTAMQAALVSINSLTPEAKKRMDSLGLSYKVNAKEGTTLGDVFVNISKAGGGTLEGVKKLIPAIEGSRAILALASQEGKNYEDVMKLMGKRAGATAEAYAAMTNTFEFKSERIKASFTSAFIEMGNQILPEMEKFADYILENMDQIKFGMKLAAALIKDAWNGVSLILTTVQATALAVVSGIVGMINMLPKSFIPDGWEQGLNDLDKTLNEAANGGFLEVKRKAQEIADEGSATLNVWNEGTSAIEAQATSMKDLTDKQKELLGIKKDTIGVNEALIEQEKLFVEQQVSLMDEAISEIESLYQDFHGRTFEGELDLIEQQRQEIKDLLVAAEMATLENISLVDAEYDAKAEDALKAHLDKEKAIKEKAAQDEMAKKVKLLNGEYVTQKRFDKAVADSREDLTDAIISSSARALTALVGDSKTAKKIALVEATIQGFLAVQKALASAAPPVNFLLAGAVGVNTAANVAGIAAQAFAVGGFPKGKNAYVQVNEAGQESILNAQATSNLGKNTINDLNAGASPISYDNRNIDIKYSPTYKITNDQGDGGIINMIEGANAKFAIMLQNMLKEGSLKMQDSSGGTISVRAGV